MVFVLIVVCVVATPFLLFIGFSGGFKRNPNSSTTFTFNESTNILTTKTWYTNKKCDVIDEYILIDGEWYTFPIMKKCNKEESELFDKHKL